LLDDLETLTGLKLNDWTAEIDGEEYEASEEIMKEKIILNPNKYKMEKDSDEDEEPENDLNEMRLRAGIDVKTTYVEDDYIKHLKSIARV
jgi:hypothetical protein